MSALNLRRIARALFCATIMLLLSVGASRAVAQNMRKFEEEAIKDKEKKEKINQLIDERKREEEELLKRPITEEDIKEHHLVEVEPINILPSDLTNVYKIMPYRIRRAKWGHLFSLAYSSYKPTNYQSKFTTPSQGTFDQLYGRTELPLVEMTYDYKYNFSLGSLALEMAYGYYKNDSNSQTVLGTSTLTVQPVRVGVKYIMDNLFFEPYAAPYIVGGVYSTLFSEKRSTVTFSGNTQLAPYIGAGVMAQLNWLDTSAAVDSYNESGLENTYFFAEVRQYMKSAEQRDPNFSNDPALGMGVAFEF